MTENLFDGSNERVNKIADDIMRPVGINRSFTIWMMFAGMFMVACLWAYGIQLNKGLGVTGMRDYVSWGMYISHFVFFVAVALVGMLISAVLGLIGYKWITPIARIAEMVAVSFATVAGLVIVSDMGRPDRVHHIFMFGRVQSPILWDVTVITTYMVISLLLYFLPLIPDLAIGKSRLKNQPKWVVQMYEILSVKWQHTPKQYKLLAKMIRILLVLVVPTAFAIHTVTSWLFASTFRTGWDSTIFGPYFLSGAFVAGSAAVVIAMFFFRNNYKLDKYITHETFDKMGKLLVLVSLVYFYFNINEYLVPAYKMKGSEAHHLHELFAGKYAPLFYFTQVVCLIIPIILVIFKPFRKPLPLTIISIFVLIGAWLKRYIIVIPTMEEPFLPKQHVPDNFMVYQPTLIEIAVTFGTFLLAIIVFTLLAKAFPVISIWETAEQEIENKPEINS